MLILAFLLFIGLCLSPIWLVVRFAVRWAKRRGRRGWVWGSAAALAMYHLMFWDLIPTLLIHRYYCATEAGFWVYKTPEEWVKENPGVLETLSVDHLPEEYRVHHTGWTECNGMRIAPWDWYYVLPDGSCLKAHPNPHRGGRVESVNFAAPDGSRGYQINERIRWSFRGGDNIPFVRRQIREVIDIGTQTVLARYVGFNWGSGWSFVGDGDPNWIGGFGTRFLGLRRCSQDDSNSGKLSGVKNRLRGKENER